MKIARIVAHERSAFKKYSFSKLGTDHRSELFLPGHVVVYAHRVLAVVNFG